MAALTCVCFCWKENVLMSRSVGLEANWSSYPDFFKKIEWTNNIYFGGYSDSK